MRAPALLEKTPLFEARSGGYHLHRIPGLLVTHRGVVLVTSEARYGVGGDYDCIDVLMRRSLDGGLAWEPPRKLVDYRQYGVGPANNCVLVSDRNDGSVHVLYCFDYARVFTMCSRDDGETFTDPVEITPIVERLRKDYPWQVIATGPGHGTQLRNGRLIVPLWMSEGTGTEFGPSRRGHRPSAVSLLYSDDHGATWQCGEIICRNGQGSIVNPSETLCVELTDGQVLFNLRNESEEHRRLVSLSPDGVSNWSDPRFEEALLEPICMASLIRYNWPNGTEPGRVLFANPDNLDNTMAGRACARKRLTVKLSYDDCRTWPVSKVLDKGPSGYSDLAVMPNGDVLCLYEGGTIEPAGDTRNLTLARFNLAWLETC
ncbi:MAG: exo-alpha-sialidase [Armatimonadetes bacterium]|nr:exo-alpha-sialidase [Armatimonadota bacterium]